MTDPTLNTERDYALIERIGQRDQRAFAQLYNHYSGAIYSALFRIVKDEEVTADLLQDSFVLVWNRAAGYDPSRGRVFNWVYTIAKNQAINWLRSEKVRPSGQQIDLADNAALYLVDTQYAVLPVSQDLDKLLQLIQELPTPLNELVRLACVEGYGHVQTAQIMNLPLGTVQGWLFKARKKLQKSINLLFDHA